MRGTLILCLLTIGSFLWAGGGGELSPALPSVTVNDYHGREVRVPLPVNRLITLNSGVSEVVAALGAADRTVGRDSFSTFPSCIRRVSVVGRNSSSPNMETILALQPDLLVADAMFDEGKIKLLENRGIPVIIVSTSNPERLPALVRSLGSVLQAEDRAEEILTLMDKALREVERAVAALELSQDGRTTVYFENRRQNKSASALSGHDFFIRSAAGVNIAASEPVKFPLLSPEFITMSNPDVIIRRVSGDIHPEAMEAMRLSIMDRPSLRLVDAVKKGRVYIVKSDLFISLRYPVGIAYFAHLLYPEAFELDPSDVHRRYIRAFYGEGEWEAIREIYVYP